MEHMLDCMHSIIRFPSQDGYDFYVMHSDLRNQDQVYIYEEILSENVMVHFCYVDPDFFHSFQNQTVIRSKYITGYLLQVFCQRIWTEYYIWMEIHWL